MKAPELSDIKGPYEISAISSYVVFTGPKLIIYHQDGTFVASRPDLGMVRKCALVSSNTILIDYSAHGFYSLISLTDGTEIWRTAQPKLDYTCNRFALSPNKRYAYDRYDLRGKLYFIEIDLISGSLHKHQIKNELRCVSDMICDQNGNVVFLEQHYEENDDSTKESISRNRISCVCNNSITTPCFFKQIYQWEFQHSQISRYFLGNKDIVLTQDLYVYTPQNKKTYSLIENTEKWENPGNIIAGYRLEMDRPYITLLYDTVNVVIDLNARKMIARYKADYRFGCIVGSEYWVITDDGLLKKPFPYIEEIPVQKRVFWSPFH